MTDPQLRQEAATAVARHLRANLPGDSNVDDVEATFATAIVRTAELVIPRQERKRPGRGWSGDAQTEAGLQTATDAMHAAWQRLKTDTRDAQLRKAVRKVCNWLKRVRSAAVVRFSSATSLSWRSSCVWETSMDSSKTSNRCSWRRRRRSNHSASMTREGDYCATKDIAARDGCDSSVRCQTLNPTCSIPTYQRGCRSNQSRVPSRSSPRRRRLPQR